MQFSKFLVVFLAGLAPTMAMPSLNFAEEKRAAVYGCNVDTVDGLPSTTTKPAALAKRPDGTITGSGNYAPPCGGCIGGTWLLFWDSSNVTLSGTGYVHVRWEVAWFNAVGEIQMPTWVGLKGKLFHVASGGGRREDDVTHTDTGETGMGDPGNQDTLPAGAQQMWSDEFYYLDGTVTLQDNEGWADYNLGVEPYTWADINTDINTGPPNVIRYGKTRDTTGDDSAPVPQYLTRAVVPQGGYASVAQDSRVGLGLSGKC